MLEKKEKAAAEFIAKWMREHEGEMADTSDKIFRHPEVSLQEKESSRYLAECLEEKGFETTWGLAGLETAFLAEWGSEGPVIGFLAEYDALPGLGQEVSSQYSPAAATTFWELPVPGRPAL